MQEIEESLVSDINELEKKIEPQMLRIRKLKFALKYIGNQTLDDDDELDDDIAICHKMAAKTVKPEYVDRWLLYVACCVCISHFFIAFLPFFSYS